MAAAFRAIAQRRSELIGQRFGRLIVLAFSHVQSEKSMWLCRCDCGTEKAVGAAALRRGRTTSCGCFDRERRVKHGKSQTPEFVLWGGMKDRCSNPKAAAFPRYGGRGIKVCDRWRDSFENFLADMGSRPSPKHEIDRKDNDGPYSPENCRWATRREQCRNTSTNRRLELNGQSRTIAEWSDLTGIKQVTIGSRLRLGWTVERTLTEPVAASAEVAHA